jgi:hypothetical protein
MAVALLVAGCGGATATASPTPTIAVSPSARISASPSAAASGSSGASASASASAAATDQDTIGFPHVDRALEDLLPGTIGGIALTKLSEPLSSYDATSPYGDKLLYPAWLVKFGKTPDDVHVAIAWDPLLRENFVVQAMQVPGVDAATLTSSFSDAARAAGWPVSARSDLVKPVLIVTDPTVKTAGAIATAYVYAHANVLYVVITDDVVLLNEGLASLP